MRWSIAKAVTIGLVLLSNVAVAQPQAEESLILSTQCGRFHLVLGRIKLDCFHYKKVRLHQATEAPSEDEEFVCVTANDGTPSLHYLRHLGRSKVTIDTTQSDCVRIEAKQQHPTGIQKSLLIQQNASGPIEITRTIGTHREQIQTASFWHLMAEQPQLFEAEISPLLSLMIMHRPLARDAQRIDQHLRRQAERSPTITKAWVQERIDALASPTRRERLAAQRHLTSAGVGILPLLDQIDRQRLDAEQIQLIGKLKQQLVVDRSDTPDRVAAWLATDQAYWANVSRRWTPRQQETGNQYMLATCGEGLDVDTTAIALKSQTAVQ
ncbi:hypothetical protein Poly24_48760 [Rosistilla carotiformis]|uniref:Secreted protein n=1 Tax=Rosistilla carotiformis TaxID=2528017 RepID=A0A518K022_9BACT|nr:hypothetical protein [Rosistilla carotiformis]QDV71142.1 hypothetical protein Poly24_48760 [Rosistilla carotiformis]